MVTRDHEFTLKVNIIGLDITIQRLALSDGGIINFRPIMP